MAQLSEEAYRALRDSVDAWHDEQDGDLMVAAFETNTLLAGECDRRFNPEEQGFLRACILVKRYDMLRGNGVEVGGLKKIEAWMSERLPNGVPPDYPFQYLMDDPPDGGNRRPRFSVKIWKWLTK